MASCGMLQPLRWMLSIFRSSSYSSVATHAHVAHAHFHHHSHSEYLHDETPFFCRIEVIILLAVFSVKGQLYFWILAHRKVLPFVI